MNVVPDLEVRLPAHVGNPATLCIVVESRRGVRQDWQNFEMICIGRSTFLSGGKVIVFQKLTTSPQPSRSPVRLFGRQGSVEPPQKSFDIDLEPFLID